MSASGSAILFAVTEEMTLHEINYSPVIEKNRKFSGKFVQ